MRRQPRSVRSTTAFRRRIAVRRWALVGFGALAATWVVLQYTNSGARVANYGPDQHRDLAIRTALAAESRAMVQRLAAIAAASDTADPDQLDAPVFGTNHPGVIRLLRGRMQTVADPLQRIALQFELAHQLLLAGFPREALQEFDGVRTALGMLDLPDDRRRQEAARLHGAIGIAALRLGEQENCFLNHRATSCLFPIEQGGEHTIQDGARRAIQAFTQQLADEPDNRGAMWLLNLAYMTVGEYPHKVPPRWRISPDVFRSDHDIGRFTDVAPETGLDVTGLAGGSIVEDFDGDGLLDVVASSWGLRDQLRFFRNAGNGRFIERTREAGLIGQFGGINLTHADYDNDGWPDIFVIRGGWLREAGLHPNSLLRNNGDGTFHDVTESAGMLAFHPTHTAAWGDFDADGFLDLFVGNEDGGSGRHPVQLYRNNGDGTFTDRAAEAGFGVLGMVKGAGWGDFDNDGRVDLYVSRFGQPNMLFRNDGLDATGAWRFTDVAERAGVREPIFSFPTWFWDYDNDGWLDIFVGGWDGAPVDAVAAHYLGVQGPQGAPRLFRNRGNGTFDDVTVEAKLDRVLLAMGANFGDLDNDGFLDLYVGTGAPDLRTLMPNRMFRNAAGKFFQDVTTAGGFGHLQKGHGISFGDLDNDGDQDVHAVMGGWFSGDAYQNVLFENPGHGKHWLSVTLVGTRSNRMGLGARLKVRVTTPRGPRDIYRSVSTGGSFGSSPFRQAIGLGDATSVETVEVAWPGSQRVQVFHTVPMNQFLSIREGDDTLGRTALAPFALGGSGSGGPLSHRHDPVDPVQRQVPR